MNKEFPELQKLLQLRGQGGPGDEYFEEFLDEFHRRQRQDLMKRSARSLFVERMVVWLREMGTAKWIYGAAVAYALVMVGFFAWPKEPPSQDLLQPASAEYPLEEEVLRLEPEAAGDEEPAEPTEF